MIQLTRSLARQLRNVFKSLVSRQAISAVTLHAGADGLRARLHSHEAAAAYHLPGAFPPDQITCQLDLLAETMGKDASPIILEKAGSEVVQARWTDAGIPMAKNFASPDISKWQAFPALADRLASNPPELLSALDEAVHSADSQAVRFATDKIQLRSTGVIVATDGRQLLWQEGWSFPWQGDVLVPAAKVFASKELPHDEPILIGKTASHVTIQVGAWSVFFPADTEGRYPKVDQILPDAGKAHTHLRLDPEDAAFLGKALTHLPGAGEINSPVTLDLNGAVAVRAKAPEQAQPNELILARSQFTGKAVTLNLDRNFLARTVQLGLTDLHIQDQQTPVIWQNDRRKYVVVPLNHELVIPPSPQALRVYSGAETAPVPERNPMLQTPNPTAQPLQETAAPPVNGTAATLARNGTMHPLIEEAQAIRTMLHDAYERSGRLITAFKQYHRRTRTLQTALVSLRQLQSGAA